MEQSGENTAPFNVLLLLWVKNEVKKLACSKCVGLNYSSGDTALQC